MDVGRRQQSKVLNEFGINNRIADLISADNIQRLQ